MGNKEFKQAYSRVAEDGFDAKGLESQYGHLLFRKPQNDSEQYKFNELCFSRNIDSKELYKMFKKTLSADQSNVDQQDQEQASEERLRDELLKSITIGYTTSESKLNQLKQGEFEKFQFKNIKKALSYEEKSIFMNSVLVAMFYAKSRGGTKVDQSLMEYLSENNIDEPNQNQAVLIAMDNPIQNIMVHSTFLSQNQELVKQELKNILLKWPQDCEPIENFMHSQIQSNLANPSIHRFLMSVLETPNGDQDNNKLALKLLLKVGTKLQLPIILLSCVYYMLKHQIDISKDLEYWCDKPEQKDFESQQDLSLLEFKKCEETLISDEPCQYGSFGDASVSQMSLSQDAWALDDKYIYNYSSDRGLSRALMNKHGAWMQVEASNQDIKGLESVSMIQVEGKLLLRHSGLTERPFTVYDCQTLQEASEDHHIISEEGQKTLEWSIDQSESNIRLLRHMAASPLAHDGKFIYAMSTLRDRDSPKVIKSYVLEVYELKDGKILKKVRSTKLYTSNLHREEQAQFKEQKFKKLDKIGHHYKSEGGMLDHVSIACNGDVLLVNYPHLRYFFNLRRGSRVGEKLDLRKSDQPKYQIAYDYRTHRMIGFEIGVMNCYQSSISFKDFERSKYQHFKQTVPPVVLDQVKNQMKREINEMKETEVKPLFQDFSKSLFRRSVKSNSLAIASLDKELRNEAQSKIPKVVEASAATILSNMATYSESYMTLCKKNQGINLIGNDMSSFYMEKNSVQINEETFLILERLILDLLNRLSSGKIDLYLQVSLLASLKLLKANLTAVKICKMTLSDILEPEDLDGYKTFSKSILDKIEDYSVDGEVADISVELRYQKVICWHAKEVIPLLNQLSYSESPIEKIDMIIKLFAKARSGDQAQLEQAKILLSAIEDPRSIRQILRGSPDEISRVQDALSQFLDYSNEQVLIFLQNNASDQILNKDNTFIGKVSLFIKEYSEVMLVQYGLLCQEIEELKATLEEFNGKKEKDLEIHERENKIKTERQLQTTQKYLSKLEPLFFGTFDILAKSYKDFFKTFTESASKKLSTPQAVYEFCSGASNKLRKMTRESDSILYIFNLYTKAFQFMKIGTNWLDEVAESLKTSLEALDQYVLFTQNIDPYLLSTMMAKDHFFEEVQDIITRICYTIGVISAQLIDKKKESEDKSEDETQKENIDKLSIIKGGIESRFIQTFSQKTKSLIEGFFKIMHDSQLREYALGDAEAVMLTDEDKLLEDILIKKEKSEDDDLGNMFDDMTQLTLDVLQQSMLSKVPASPYARIAGNNGLRLTRAAFAAILKLSDNLNAFTSLSGEIEMCTVELSPEITGTEKLKKILIMLQEKECHDLQPLMNRWEQATEIRRWLTDKKSYLSQEIVKEAKIDFIKEVNLSDPSHDGKFEGPLSPEQDQLIEDRSFNLLEVRLEKLVDDMIQKASFLLKLRIPEEFQQAQKEEQAQEARKRSSQQQNLLRSSSSQGPQSNQNIPLQRKKTVGLESGLQKVESVFDWTERIQNWQQMQLSQGTITDFSTPGLNTSMSCTLMVLQCLKADYSSTQLKEYIESQMIGGLRRAAGMNLLNFAMNQQIPDKAYFILIQWFQRTLREGNGDVVQHFMNQVSGCGENVHSIARKEFFSILRSATQKLKTTNDEEFINNLLDVFYWSYKSADLLELAKIDIFKVLQEGDGTRENLLRMSWGHLLKQEREEKDNTLTRRVVKIFNFLFKVVLKSIVNQDTCFDQQNQLSRSTSILNSQKRTQTSLVNSAEHVMQQIFDVLFGNVQRYVDVVDRFKPGLHSIFELQHTEIICPDQQSTDLLIDDFEYFEANQGRQEVLRELQFQKTLKMYKINLLIHRLQKERIDDPVNGGAATTLVNAQLSDKVILSQDTCLVEQIIQRNPFVIEKVEKMDFAALDLIEPSKDELAIIQRIREKVKKIKPEDDVTESKPEQVDKSQKPTKKISPMKKAQSILKIWQQLSKDLTSASNPIEKKKARASHLQFFKCFPPQWLSLLQQNGFGDYWSFSSFFEEEYLKTEECCGISINQFCVITDRQEEFKGDEGDGLIVQFRESRGKLCKDCFWYRVLQNILDTNRKSAIEELAMMLSRLPDSLKIFSLKPKDLIKIWQTSANIVVDEEHNDQETKEPSGNHFNGSRVVSPDLKPNVKFRQIKEAIEWLTDVLEPNSDNSSEEEEKSRDSQGQFKKFTIDQKRFMWRHLGSMIPLQWSLNFERREFNRFRIERQGSDSSLSDGQQTSVDDTTPYESVGRCQGAVRNMVCFASTKTDDMNYRMHEEERMSRSVLCKDCYWFMSSVNVIMEGDDQSVSESSSCSGGPRGQIWQSLKKYLNMLPSSYDLFMFYKKPNDMWSKILQIYDRKMALQNFTASLTSKLLDNSTNNESESMTNLYRNFAQEFDLVWLQGFHAKCFQGFQDTSASGQTSYRSPMECTGFKAGFVCVDESSENGNETANQLLDDIEILTKKSQTCEKCYLMRILLLVFLHQDQRNNNSIEKIVQTSSDEDNQELEELKKASDTRACRETVNAMMKKLSASLPIFNLPLDKLLSHWAISSGSAATNTEDKKLLTFVAQSKRLDDKGKAKTIKLMINLIAKIREIRERDDLSDLSGCRNENWNQNMIMDTFSKLRKVDINSLHLVLRHFWRSLPDGFLDAFIVKHPLDDDDDKEYEPEAKCCGLKKTDFKSICLLNTELTDEEKILKLEGNDADDLKHCYGCAKQFQFYDKIMTLSDYSDFGLDVLPVDLPLFELGSFKYIYNQVKFNENFDEDKESKSKDDDDHSSSSISRQGSCLVREENKQSFGGRTISIRGSNITRSIRSQSCNSLNSSRLQSQGSRRSRILYGAERIRRRSNVSYHSGLVRSDHTEHLSHDLIEPNVLIREKSIASIDSGRVKPVEAFRKMLSEDEEQDEQFFSVKNFINKSDEDQLKWLRESAQEHLWKDIESEQFFTSTKHGVCDHDMGLMEGKQFFCDCPYAQELHFGFDARFYDEAEKPWYRCEICEKCYCLVSMQLRICQNGLKTGSELMVNVVKKLIDDRRLIVGTQDLSQKLKNLSEMRVAGSKKNKISVKNLYHDTFLLRILEMLDFFSSLALTSPATLALIQKFIEPRHLQYLVKLLISGLPYMKVIAIKIFQSLLSLQIPHEVLGQAVLECMKKDEQVQKTMAIETEIDLEKTPFFKLMFNLLLQNKQKLWEDNDAEMRGCHAFAQELAGLFTGAFMTPCSDQDQVVRQAIFEHFNCLHKLSTVEIETVMTIVPQSSFNQIQKGSHIINQNGQKMTVLGFYKKNFEEANLSKLLLRAELTEEDDSKYIYGLYFNQKNPERQEVISIRKQDYQVINSLSDDDSRKLAIGSPFYNIETIGYFFELLQGNKAEYKEDKFKYAVICNYLIRGFSNIITELKKDYVNLLQENQMSKPLLNMILSLAGQNPSSIRKNQLSSLPLLELQTDMIKKNLLLKEESLKGKDTNCRFYLSSTEKNFIIKLTQEKRSTVFKFMISKIASRPDHQRNQILNTMIKRLENVNLKSQQMQDIVIIDTDALKSLSDQVLQVMCKSEYVLTSDEVNLGSLLENLRKKILHNNAMLDAGRTSFITTSKDDLEMINRIIDSSFEENATAMKAQDEKDDNHSSICHYLARFEAKGYSLDQAYSKLAANEDKFLKSADTNMWLKITKLIEDAFQIEGELSKEEKDRFVKELQRLEKELSSQATSDRTLIQIYEQKAIEDQNDSKVEESKGEQAQPLSMELPDFSKVLECDTILGNYVTSQLESDEVAEQRQEISSEELQEKFNLSIRVPNDHPGYKKLLQDNLETLTTMHSFDAFQNLIAFGYKDYDDLANDLEESPEMFQKLCNLIHQELKYSYMQWLENSNKAPLKRAKDKARKLLNSMLENAYFQQYLVADLISRGMIAIDKVRQDEDFDIPELTVKNMNEMIGSDKALNPLILNFIIKVLLSSTHVSAQDSPHICLTLFNLLLSQVTIFCGDFDSKIVSKLTLTCSSILQIVLTHIRKFVYESQVVENFVNNNILQMICLGLDFDVPELSERKRSILNLHVQLFAIHDQAIRKKLKDFTSQLCLNKQIVDNFKARCIFQDGRKFDFMRQQMLLKYVQNNIVSQQIVKRYKTDSYMFKTNIDLAVQSELSLLQVKFKAFSSQEMLKITNHDGLERELEKGLFDANTQKQIFFLNPNQQMRIQFPIRHPIAKLAGEIKCTAQLFSPFNHSKLTAMKETREIKAVQVFGSEDHYCFVSEDESIWGVGNDVQGITREDIQLRKIEKPANCVNYLKISCGKSQRWILTKQGEIFCNGVNQQACAGSGVQYDVLQKKFINVTNQFKLEKFDSIVDVAGGNNFVIIATKSGKVYGMGIRFASAIKNSLKYQNALPKDVSYEICIPEYKAVKVYASEECDVAFILAKKDGKNILLSAGTTDQLLGLNSNLQKTKFEPILIPEHTEVNDLSLGGRNAWALDKFGNLWTWGYRSNPNPQQFKSGPNIRPGIVNYFKDQNMKVIKIRAGQNFSIALAQKRTGDEPAHLYFLDSCSGRMNSYLTEISRKMSPDVEKLIGVDANALDFACAKNSFLFLFGEQSQQTNYLIPSKPEAKGVVHSYQSESIENVHLTVEEYHQQKETLPTISIAVKQAIESEKYAFQALLLMSQVREFLANVAQDEEEKVEFKSSLNGLPINNDQTLYFSFSDIDEQPQKIYLTENELFQEGNPFDINPLIYYRLKAGNHHFANRLPKIELANIYQKSRESSQIHFTVKQLYFGVGSEQEKSELLNQLSEEQRLHFTQLGDFTEEMDSEIVRQIDRYLLSQIGDKNIEELTVNDFDCTKFVLSDQNFKDVNPEVIKMRTELFIKFTQKFLRDRKWIKISTKDKEGSLGSDFIKCKSLVLATIKNKLLDESLQTIDQGSTPVVEVSRRKAMIFADSGQVDHKGEKTVFGQTFQQIKRKEPSFKNFRQKSTDQRCWKINFLGEGSMDYGGPFRDSLVNISRELETGVLPLLIKSPNNRSEVGVNRECYLLNPEATSPSHLEMFHFLGCIIGFGVMSKSPVPLNLAPTVWKQILGESLNHSDLDGIDLLSANALKDLLSHSKSMTEEDFATAAGGQAFTTVLSHGSEVALCDDGYQKQVTQANVQEFINLVIKARQEENCEQIRELRRGVETVLGNLQTLSLMEWHQIEVRACGEKTLSIENLKSITSYPRCGSDHKIIIMFWRVFEERFTEEERQLYLKFVWGRTRLPIDLTNLSYKHEIRYMTSLGRNAFPKAHTCFFQLDIPDYDDDDICYKKFQQAITMCGSVDIDTDNIGNESD